MSTDNKDRSSQSAEYKSRRMFNFALIFLVLSFLLFLCQLINFGVFNTSARGSNSLPVSIRANSHADYSRDLPGMSIPPISGNILNQIILDMSATGEPRDRIATLEVALSQPVPTMTPNPLFPTAIIPSPTPSKTSVPTISKTSTPTKSFTPVKTATHTSQPVFTLTKTFTPVKTSTHTPTPIPTETFTHTATPTFTPLTATSTATATPTPTPTSTEAVQTDTPTPTATVGVPTETPTPTATPVCMLISGGISSSGRRLEMTLTNNGSTPSVITGILVDWPDMPESQALTEVKLNGETIINSDDPLPPSDYPSERNWIGNPADLELAALDSKLLVLLFTEDLQPGGYSITVTFDNGCTLSGSH